MENLYCCLLPEEWYDCISFTLHSRIYIRVSKTFVFTWSNWTRYASLYVFFINSIEVNWCLETKSRNCLIINILRFECLPMLNLLLSFLMMIARWVKNLLFGVEMSLLSIVKTITERLVLKSCPYRFSIHFQRPIIILLLHIVLLSILLLYSIHWLFLLLHILLCWKRHFHLSLWLILEGIGRV